MKIDTDLYFEWNAARTEDWPILRRNFVAAYISAYMNRSFAELQYSDELKLHAETQWENSYSKGYDSLMSQIIRPLQFYLGYEKRPLQDECDELQKHFSDKTHDITLIKEQIIKLMLLQRYFEKSFIEEKQNILSQEKKIEYLIARFHERPIGFFVSEVNFKSSHIYLRYVTLSPAFHRQGLGEKMLDEVVKHYPDATGLELYTRTANIGAQAFYKHYGFKAYSQFNFETKIIVKSCGLFVLSRR